MSQLDQKELEGEAWICPYRADKTVFNLTTIVKRCKKASLSKLGKQNLKTSSDSQELLLESKASCSLSPNYEDKWALWQLSQEYGNRKNVFYLDQAIHCKSDSKYEESCYIRNKLVESLVLEERKPTIKIWARLLLALCSWVI